MTTSLDSPAPTRVPLRLQLHEGKGSGLLDGAWWPQSRDLQAEVADLVDHFPAGRVNRLLFSRPDWDAEDGARSQRRIQAERGPVKVGSFPGDDTHVMIAAMASGQRLRLLVVPSSAEAGPAETAMAAASAQGNSRTASDLLGL